MHEPRTPRRSRSRRDFLRTAAAAGAVAIGPSVLTGRSLAASSDEIRVGLIGCGGRGTGAAVQAMNVDAGVRITAVADVFEDHVRSSLNSMRKAKPEQVAVDDDHAFAGFDGAKNVLQSDIDVVLIACASRFHPEYLRDAIRAGKHVFVEKPHAIDPPGIRTVLAAADEAKRKGLCVVSGLHRRYMDPVREMIRRVQDGAIGDIISMEVSFMRAPYKVVERRPEWSEMEWQYKTWYHFRWLSGDDVPQSLVHTSDVASWALGEAAPLNAHGLAGRSASFGMKYGDVFDHDAVVYEFPSGARMYALTRTQHGCHGEVQVKLMGTKGHATEGRIEGENPWRWAERWPSGHQHEQTEFFAALRAGKVLNNGSYMARSTLITILGQMACYTGKKITWDEIQKSDFRYPPHDGRCDFSAEPPVKPGPDGTYPVPEPGRWKMA